MERARLPLMPRRRDTRARRERELFYGCSTVGVQYVDTSYVVRVTRDTSDVARTERDGSRDESVVSSEFCLFCMCTSLNG